MELIFFALTRQFYAVSFSVVCDFSRHKSYSLRATNYYIACHKLLYCAPHPTLRAPEIILIARNESGFFSNRRVDIVFLVKSLYNLNFFDLRTSFFLQKKKLFSS